MVMNEVYLKQLRTVAADLGGDPDISDDALIYVGSAVWADWRNHVPGIVKAMWPLLDESARLVAYIAAKQASNKVNRP
jgi:hypothetical protein